jgi:hypothetical protein
MGRSVPTGRNTPLRPERDRPVKNGEADVLGFHPMSRVLGIVGALLLAELSIGATSHFGLQKRSHAESENVDLHIAGEVSQGRTFEYDLGHGLLFRLAPPANAESAGWLIEIVPKSDPDDGPIEFCEIATPPYHVYNDRCIAVAYGRSASEVVQLKDRTFYFVHTEDDEHRAEEVVNAKLYPTNTSDEEKVRVAAEEHQIQLGKGELRILKSHVSRSGALSGTGSIESIRFEVDFEFSPRITMADVVSRVTQSQ